MAIPAAIGCGAALQAVVGGFLARRLIGFPSGLVEVGQVARLFIFGGAIACLINATVGVGILYATGRVAASNVPFNWTTWWAGDAIGVFTFTSLVIAWLSPARAQWQQRRLPIAVSLGVTFALTVALVGYTASLERANFAGEFNDRSNPLALAMEKAAAIRIGTVGSVEALLASSPARSPQEFTAFASRIRALAPGIHGFISVARANMDGRDEPGHDDLRVWS